MFRFGLLRGQGQFSGRQRAFGPFMRAYEPMILLMKAKPNTYVRERYSYLKSTLSEQSSRGASKIVLDELKYLVSVYENELKRRGML